MTWTTLSATAQSYSTQTAAATTWQPSGLSIEVTSGVSRLKRVYPQADSATTDVNFIYRVQTEFPWYVATGNSVIVASTITVGV